METAKTPVPVEVAATKPNPSYKNADGTPNFKTYEDFVEALIEWKVRQLLGPDGRITQ